MIIKRIWMLCLLICLGGKIKAQTPGLQLTTFATGFSSITSLAHCNDDRLFVVQQRGRIRIVDINSGTVNATDFLNLTSLVSQSGSERGLLGLAFHPDYLNNGYFFVSYTDNGGSTVIARYKVSDNDVNVANPASAQILLTFTQPYSNHNGGDIHFGKDGYLYFASGDGGSGGDPQNFAQNNQSLLGKMLRIDVNDFNATTYTVPPSNPFVGNAAYRPEIWATGLRNPWRFSFDRLTGDMWMGDVGQNVMEEINFQPANSPGGENYGWRCYEGINTYNTSGCGPAANYVFPVFHYNQSGNGCSVTGGFVYRGALSNYMYGRYWFADYCSGRIWSFPADGSNNYTATVHGNFVANNYVAFGEDRYGELYLAERGRVMRFTVNACEPVAKILETSAQAICDGETSTLRAAFHPQLTYQWFKDGEAIDNASNEEFIVTEPGNYYVEVTRDNCSSNSEVVSITFAPGFPVEFSILEENLCINDSTISLIASPSGGTFAGAGVAGNELSAAIAGVGTHVITYSYTEPGFCLSVVRDTLTVNALPQVSVSALEAVYCIDASPVILIGSPSGGTFEGANQDGIFNPSSAGIGAHVITYSFTDDNACTASVQVSTSVDACLQLNELLEGSIQVYPIPASKNIFIEFATNPLNEAEFMLSDLKGNKIASTIQKDAKRYELKFNELTASGVYLLRITADGQTINKRILIKQ
jgi:hypothetical protein